MHPDFNRRIIDTQMPYTYMWVTINACVLLYTHVVCAQTDHASQTSAARELFKQGVALADEEQWQEAADRFQRAYRLHPSPGLAFNLMAALEKTGRLVEARELLYQLRNDPQTPSSLSRRVTKKLDLIDPKIASLSIELQGNTENIQVLRNGVDVPHSVWNVPFPVDPGEHTVVIYRDGTELNSERIELGEGEERRITLSVPEMSVPASIPNPSEAARKNIAFPERTSADPQEPEDAIYEKWWFWSGIGVVVVGTALAFLLVDTGTNSEEAIVGNAEPGVLKW